MINTDIEIYNQSFQLLAILDVYESLIWNVRYYENGDFELIVPDKNNVLKDLAVDNYISIASSDRYMIIEKQEPQGNTTDGNKVKISGRSLESILARRIIWNQTTVSGNLQNAIKKLITDAIINPSIADRKISNFIFVDSTDPAVTGISISETQFTGDNLLEVISSLCKVAKIGFKITLNSNKQFCFQLYAGVERTNRQLNNPTVEFSANNDNLISTKFVMDKTNYCNVTLIAGEGEGVERKTSTYGSGSGLHRRELFTDARDISSNAGSEEEIPLADYLVLLQQRGKEKLAERVIERTIDSKVDSSDETIYKFNSDYFLGDIVDVVDYGDRVSTSRIVEMTTTITTSDISLHPIFEYEDLVSA